ncbi:hypothetical protein AB0756_39015 [Tolypothrix campylonemoides VB511288_2]|uniref:Uncharacterized protein n=2 Tax=Tolypothrix TaxID=111782 RepID=A0A0C1QWM1_9CYAN
MLRSGAWAKVAKKSNTTGGFHRNKFYFSGSNKKVPTNRRMHGKLRSQRRAGVPPVEVTGVQTSISPERKYGIVQVLEAPYIRQKPRAIGFPTLKHINA